MANGSLIRTYAIMMLILNLAFVMLNATGIFPMGIEIAGLDFAGNFNNTVDALVSELTNTFENKASALDYLAISGFVIYSGIRIVIDFVLMVLVGMAAVLAAIGIPAVLYVPIVAVTDALMVYEVAAKLRG